MELAIVTRVRHCLKKDGIIWMVINLLVLIRKSTPEI